MNKMIIENIEQTDWFNWKWQEKFAIKSTKQLIEIFPNLDNDLKKKICLNEEVLKIKLTPYLISLMKIDEKRNPILHDPIWSQFVPCFDVKSGAISTFNENWELEDEMITPILQHKYYNRVNVRIQNSCHSYCTYCFEAKRVLDKHTNKRPFNIKDLDIICEYICENNHIEEIVISGGEPLMLDNKILEKALLKFRNIKQIKTIRIQTRVLTHNPFRLDDMLIKLLIKYDVTALTFHITHPNEISMETEKIIKRFAQLGCDTILLAHIPLLKSINDDSFVLKELFMKLFSLKIKPYYLLHSMPDTLGADKFRTSVRKGVEILRTLKRYYSNPAIPEYIIVHKSGKHTVPNELDGTSEFQYNEGFIRFKNWKGEWCSYNDSGSDN
jgi:lysine 2,3-aminomutase